MRSRASALLLTRSPSERSGHPSSSRILSNRANSKVFRVSLNLKIDELLVPNKCSSKQASLLNVEMSPWERAPRSLSKTVHIAHKQKYSNLHKHMEISEQKQAYSHLSLGTSCFY